MLCVVNIIRFPTRSGCANDLKSADVKCRIGDVVSIYAQIRTIDIVRGYLRGRPADMRILGLCDTVFYEASNISVCQTVGLKSAHVLNQTCCKFGGCSESGEPLVEPAAFTACGCCYPRLWSV